MATHPLWRDEYWLLLMQIYLKKPVGVKPVYSKPMVELGLELHIDPQVLYKQMFRLRQLDTPQMEKLWERYGKNPRRLSKEVKLLRQMNGYGSAGSFYEGVDVNESFEKDFRPVADDTKVRPVDLIMILDLYFRLTPLTMVPETEEIQELAKMLKITPEEIVDTMDVFKVIDPYLGRDDIMIHPMLEHCKAVWNRYASENPTKLAALAAQLREYYKGGK
ncbi:MAG: hypothetical protein IJL45_03510 [Prevotella sp.]|jgi:hypothetical protein|nr:hypothetical protein [Prevotella sp.]MBQ6161300.1 hypothetical protein [Prevotella sp.]